MTTAVAQSPSAPAPPAKPPSCAAQTAGLGIPKLQQQTAERAEWIDAAFREGRLEGRELEPGHNGPKNP
ncbi:hypothetical protein GCM10009549_28860 [Streptomyces thermoalcalitolerans]|uniref:Uncharacterized protein n=1 Tax=Streptomyces thermoalcalitolerans TaxID=65605 RepID=A0ABN1NR41_9ACTN